MFATLKHADAAFFQGVGLRGFMHVLMPNEQESIYALCFPTNDEPQPPGWATIERLSGVTASEVITAWEDDDNPVAKRAMHTVAELHRGQRFLVAEETPLVSGGTAIELTELPMAMEPSKRLVRASELVEIEAPQHWAPVTSIVPEGTYVAGRAHAYVTIQIDNVPAHAWPRFQVPDPDDQTPPDWWFFETFTGISHERVADSWAKLPNQPLQDTLQKMAELVHGADVPLRADGMPDIDLWRRLLVRARLARGYRPYLFLNRPTADIHHMRALLGDTTGDFLYLMQHVPGKARGIPTHISEVGNKPAVMALDNHDVCRQWLVRYINFARSGKPPKYIYPPKELVSDIIYYPDPTWPKLRGIARIPVLRPDGTVLDREGFDKLSGLWYAPEFELEPIPEQISKDDIARAKALILAPVAEFPFVADQDRTAFVAALLEQIVLPMIRGPRPIYVFDAPQHGQGTGKCNDIDSLALTSRGLLYMYELAPGVGTADTARSVRALRVPTHDGSVQAVSHYYFGGTKPIRRIHTRRGFELGGTHVHPLRVATPDGAAWRPMSQLRVGDYIALHVAPHEGATVDQVDADCAWLLGALTADGSLSQDAGAPTYTKGDAQLRKRVTDLAFRYLQARTVTPTSTSDTHPTEGLRFNGPEVRAAMTQLDLTQTTAAGKRIPKTVRGSSSKIWAAFLRGLFDGDAHIDRQGFEWVTASEQLSREVQIMLSALGVWAARKPRKVQLEGWTAPRTYWRLTFNGADLDVYARQIGFTKFDKQRALTKRVEGAQQRNTNIDVIPTCGADGVISLIRAVYASAPRTAADSHKWKVSRLQRANPSRQAVQALLDTSPDTPEAQKLREMTAPHVRWDRVVAIAEEEVEVADLSVPVNHSFVANGIQNHNTLLAKIVQSVIAGEIVISALGSREEEIEKRITSYLREQRPVVILDNLRHEVKGAAIEQLVTAESWQARLLGGNDAPVLPQLTTWILTLNAARVNRDMVRRTVICRLQAAEKNAWKRKNFRIRHPDQWARERRAAIVRALLVLARAWVQAGQPEADFTHGSFEGWVRVVGGILEHSGFHGVDQAINEASAREGTLDDHKWLVQLWVQTRAGAPMPASELATLAQLHGLYPELLERKKAAVALGRAFAPVLQQILGQTFHGYRIERLSAPQNGYIMYTLIPEESSSDPTTPLPSH